MASNRPDDRIVILTGAGISKESGLDTFRDVDGIWAKVRLEDVATPEGYRRDPRLVQDFYNARRANLADPAVLPNAAHHALARLEQEWPGEVLLVTQNIDDLHERGGSRNLIHMHGELLRVQCTACGVIREERGDVHPDTVCPSCGSAGTTRPYVVWFGEMPLEMERIYGALETCRLFISIGTSGTVYPAAGFVQAASLAGASTVELNMERSIGADLFDEHIQGPATETVPAFVERLLAAS